MSSAPPVAARHSRRRGLAAVGAGTPAGDPGRPPSHQCDRQGHALVSSGLPSPVATMCRVEAETVLAALLDPSAYGAPTAVDVDVEGTGVAGTTGCEGAVAGADGSELTTLDCRYTAHPTTVPTGAS